MKRSTKINSESLDRSFAAGAVIPGSLETAKARRPLRQQRRVNVDFPAWMIDSLDREAGRLGVTRQSIIKVWIAERLAAADSSGR